MIIIDRREYSRGKSDINKQRFINKHKAVIRNAIDELMHREKLGNLKYNDNKTFNFAGIDEPTFNLIYSPGHTRKGIYINNTSYYRGDVIYIKMDDSGGDGTDDGEKGEAGQGDSMEDVFSYTMTRDEFLNLYFEDLALPNYIKQGIKKDKNKKLVRCGYSRDGIPARLNLRKTFEYALSRRISAKRDPEKKPRWLDDEDLRYNYYDLREFPIKHAAIFLVMDVSGSMGEERKRLAKKFYTLLYVFLMREYDCVDLVFIRHTEEARECSEFEFFHSRESGGTMIEPALSLVNKIIDERYDVSSTNIYVAQASDGDTFPTDTRAGCKLLQDTLLAKLQYFAYLQMKNARITELTKEYGKLAAAYDKFNMGWVNGTNDIFPVFSKLFKKH